MGTVWSNLRPDMRHELVLELPEKCLERLWAHATSDSDRLAIERAMASDQAYAHILPAVNSKSDPSSSSLQTSTCSGTTVAKWSALQDGDAEKMADEIDDVVVFEPVQGPLGGGGIRKCWSAVSLVLVAELIEHGADPATFQVRDTADGKISKPWHPHMVHIMGRLRDADAIVRNASNVGRALMVRRMRGQLMEGAKVLLQMAGSCLAQGACPIPIKVELNINLVKTYLQGVDGQLAEKVARQVGDRLMARLDELLTQQQHHSQINDITSNEHLLNMSPAKFSCTARIIL